MLPNLKSSCLHKIGLAFQYCTAKLKHDSKNTKFICLKESNMNVRNNRGFTLIELISALLIMGIVAAVVISRVGTSNNEVIAQMEVVKSHLRYAQSRAMNSDLVWGIRFDTDKYWLFKEGDITKKVTFPAEDSDTANLPSGMSMGTEIALNQISGSIRFKLAN